MGSKSRIAKDILPIILKDRTPNQYFVDLFCGGCNILDKVDGKRIGNDKNKYLIAMWKGLQQDLPRPKEIDKQLYDASREVYNGKENGFVNDMYLDDFMIGWIGWMASFNGRFFDGGYSGKASGRDYVAEQIKNTEKQLPLIKDVHFFNRSYDEFDFKEPCVIYCDIPYKETKQYATSKDFNHDNFWQWVREAIAKGHKVFVSEYSAPEDFRCVWSKEVTNSMSTKNTYKPIEKLFTLCT